MPQPSKDEYAGRLERVREQMERAGVDCLLVGPSTDLVYLTGLESRQSERMKLLMVPRDGEPRFVIPAFELPHLEALPPLFDAAPWVDGQQPAELLASLLPRKGGAPTVAVGAQLHTHFTLRIQSAAPDARYVSGEAVLEPARMRKTPYEVETLRAASEAADRVFEQLLRTPVEGRSEREVLGEIRRLLVANGHDSLTGGGIVGFGPNGASPHHYASDRRGAAGDAVVVDYGGVLGGYHSDLTRTFHLGAPGDEFREVYAIVSEANDAAVAAAGPGVTAEQIDRVARDVIERAGYGERFLHRTGHGIGLDGHEAPYLVTGDRTVLEEGMTFSIEPGIYLEGRFGVRIEDIVVVTANGVDRLNRSSHELQVA
jgi:Xaa-Pro aminopeptidase